MINFLCKKFLFDLKNASFLCNKEIISSMYFSTEICVFSPEIFSLNFCLSQAQAETNN